MAYVKQVWVNEDTTKPIDQTRLGHIEDGIFTAAATADVAAANASDAQAELTGRLAEAALNGLYPVYLLWDGSAYPTRVAGAFNIFFGPTDPGILMEEDDYWANPDAATIDEVVAEAADPGSDLGIEIRAAAAEIPFLNFGPGNLAIDKDATTIVRDSYGSTPDIHLAWLLPETGVSRLFANWTVPTGWSSVRVRVFYYHDQSGASGNVIWLCSMTGLYDGASITGGASQSVTSAAAAQGVVREAVATSFSVTAGRMYAMQIARNAGSAGDTLEYPVRLVGARIERLS